MSANALLLWMSARRYGSWQQFRGAVEELHVSGGGTPEGEEDDASDQFALPLYQMLRLNMQRLGHSEFFAGADGADWRVTPPSLGVTPHARGWLGVVAGARSPKFLERLFAAVASEKMEVLEFPACPDQIRIFADDSRALAAVADHAALLLQDYAPAAILTSLPPIDDRAVRQPAQLPFGKDWKIERFSPDTLGWRSAARAEAVSTSGGLFRFSLRHNRDVFFCTKGATFRIPSQVGKYLALSRRRRRVARYDVGNLRLSVPASCRPPFLVERALVLCSGSLPSYETGGTELGALVYHEIPENIAKIATALLRQEH